MKLRNHDFMISFLVGFAAPAMILFGLTWMEHRLIFLEEVSQTAETSQHMISVRTGAQVWQMDMEEYIVGVVLSEMPASFEKEALKAQAVVARTYAKRAQSTGGKHGDGSICTNPGCCQAYLSTEDYLQKGGTGKELRKIRDAVEETGGIVIVYGGECIEATFFSCSGGYTEDASQVWGGDYPYLTAKASPGERSEELAEDRVFSPKELEVFLSTHLEGDPGQWFRDWQYTNGGGVASVVIGNRKYDGVTLRQLLQLRSTLITVTVGEEKIVFHTEGYGHRVGMSQYGADALAVQGKTYEEILQYYYTGTALEKMDMF